MENKLRFAKTLKIASVAMDKSPDPDQLAVYWEFLKEYPIEQIEGAMMHCIKNNRWFPKICEIISLIEPAERSIESEAIDEWDNVVRMLSDSRSARSSNPMTESVVKDIGGYVHLGKIDQSKLVWAQKEFVQRYTMRTEYSVAPMERIGALQGIDQILERLH